MKIAIQAADLDDRRIDGTRIYILNMLAHFGDLDTESHFLIYHKGNFNPQLIPKNFPNYTRIRKPFPFRWTQTRFARQLFRDCPDRLWMPMHSLPVLRPKKTQTIVTIHDLAFKVFPQYFARTDLYKLNLLTDYVVDHADRLIAISHASKKDLLRFYPQLDERKISVVMHGFDPTVFMPEANATEDGALLQSLTLESQNYLLYTGAIQPRKNILTLLRAFGDVKKTHGSLKLVIAGEKAWLYEQTLAAIKKSRYRKDIVLTGGVDFDVLSALYRHASIFVFPSFYEGFGIPLLEAFASGVPVISADNSSLPEVGGDAALYFDAHDHSALTQKIIDVLHDDVLRARMIAVGHTHAQNFSWRNCAAQTLAVIKGDDA